MLGLSVFVVSAALAAPPATTAPKPLPVVRAASSVKAIPVSNSKPTTAFARQSAPAAPKAIRTAQIPPQPQPLKAPPLPMDAADPNAAPLPGHVPPPPAAEPPHGYADPLIAQPAAPPVAPYEGGPLPAPESVDGYTGVVDCYGCPCDDDDDGCCLCGPDCPCDLFPHYAYYPKYHGHYYFRPYNYQTIFQHQQWATCAGLDPRNPYSNKIFCQAMADFAQVYRPESGPIGSALPSGSGLPQLEDLVVAKPTP